MWNLNKALWNLNKAFVALISGLLLLGFVGESPWIVELWDFPTAWIAPIIGLLTWLAPNGRPFWQVWRASE